MPRYATKAEGYRVRAVEVRAIAETMKDKEARRILINVADDYDKMAAQVERMGLDRVFPPRPK